MKKLKIGSDYEFSDDGKNWEDGVLITVSTKMPITYQSKNFNKHEWYSNIRPVNKKPVFTQAMSDAGELPPIGSYFIHENKKVKTISTSKEDGGVVTFLDGCDIGCCWNNDSWVRPIDTRTDKEKAIEDIYRSDLTVKENLAEAYDKWTGK